MTSPTQRTALIALQLLALAAFAAAIEHWWGFGRLLAPWSAVPATLVALVVAEEQMVVAVVLDLGLFILIRLEPRIYRAVQPAQKDLI